MRTALVFLVVCLSLAGSAAAQTQITGGVIQGSVTDVTGGSLPGVTVEARNVGTNLTRSQVTGNDGRFVFLQLPSGTYSVTYTIPGFARLVQENIPLTVGQSVNLTAPMKVSGVPGNGDRDVGGGNRRDDAGRRRQHAR